ncbi:MAG TPA: Crp/Fnr family transcriptional regulator [Cyclobacteriaceae bacterium]|nr:Crp/Fnr family transcriptional regulator [Cyclobacteriaceae bacterium]
MHALGFQNILTNISRHVTLDKNGIEYFKSLLTCKNVAKHERILTEGNPCRFIYYVNSGVFRSFCTDANGAEHIVMFAIDDWWITDMHGFALEKPAIVSIEAIEDGQIFQLEKSGLEKLYARVPAFERFFRIMMQNAYVREQLRITQSLTLDATARYHSFVARYPHFMQRIPLKMIASYLGVTPQFLSVARKRKNIN